MYVSYDKYEKALKLLDEAMHGATGQRKEIIAYNRALIYARMGKHSQTVQILRPFVNKTSNKQILSLWEESKSELDRKK